MRAVVFGLGRMGLRHIEVLQSMDFEIAAACDPNADAREAAATRFAIPADRLHGDASASVEALDKVDIAVIATTAPSHGELTVMAAEAGALNILCEKPMATSLREAQTMIEACKTSGARLAINHQMRVLPHYVWAREQFGDDTELGLLSSITLTAGNFGLAMNASHYFELFRYSMNEPIVSVQAWFDDTTLPNPRGVHFEDRSGCVRATTASGKRLYLDFSADQGLGLRVTYAGRYGQLFIDELEGTFDKTVRQEDQRDRPTNLYALPWTVEQGSVEPTDALESSRSVVNAVMSGGDFPTGEDGMAVMRCLVACHLSHERGGIAVDVADIDSAFERVFPWA